MAQKRPRGFRIFSSCLCVLMLLLLIACTPTAGNTENPAGGTPTVNQAGKTIEEPTLIAAKPTATSTIAVAQEADLTAEEAIQLAQQKIDSSSDLVLWRVIPSSDKDDIQMMLDADWQSTGRSGGWFVWYAINNDTNWFMISIEGDDVVDWDVGTRSFSTMAMDANWPRDVPPVTMLEAAAAAETQGAFLEGLTWVEYCCDYRLSGYRNRPVWVFACSQDIDSGITLNYQMIVDALTGEVLGAVNDRHEEMALPIDLEALQQTRTDTHEADLRQFFQFIADGQPEWAVRQLSYVVAPNEAMAQMWLENFSSIQSLEIISIEQTNLEQWTDEWESYKVTLDIETEATEDQYGWVDGDNVRWVSIVPEGAGGWKVDALSTSP